MNRLDHIRAFNTDDPEINSKIFHNKRSVYLYEEIKQKMP